MDFVSIWGTLWITLTFHRLSMKLCMRLHFFMVMCAIRLLNISLLIFHTTLNICCRNNKIQRCSIFLNDGCHTY